MEKILIVSADDILLYQPTILNLYDYLKNDFDVTIISFQPEFLGRQRDDTRKISYQAANKFKKKMFRIAELLLNAPLKRIDKFLFKIKFRAQIVKKYKCSILLKELEKLEADHIIAVDFMPLYAAQKVFGEAHFLSLEILPYDHYQRLIDQRKIKSVIIQNQLRFDHLFQQARPKVFYIQNAPCCSSVYLNDGDRNGLVWGGTIVKEFGVFDCIRFIQASPQYSLTLKGGARQNVLKKIQTDYKDLIDSGKLVVATDYLPANDLIKFLSKFRIGICFYGWDIIRKNFNYQTAPSGKLFMYLAAGLPVIACDIPGFKFIEEYNAGVLIKDYQPQTIEAAIKKIENNYSSFQQNSYRAFADYCFEKNAGDFKRYLMMGS